MLLEDSAATYFLGWGVGGLLRNFPSKSICLDMGKSKRKERDRRIGELTAQASSHGLQVEVYNWGRHYRILGGEQAVDYWPGSGTCWIVGSMKKGITVEPNEAIALSIAKPSLPEGADEHMKSILSRGNVPEGDGASAKPDESLEPS